MFIHHLIYAKKIIRCKKKHNYKLKINLNYFSSDKYSDNSECQLFICMYGFSCLKII